MKKTNHEELQKLIRRCYEKKQPLFVQGAFGIGKSYCVKEVSKSLAKEKKREFKEWNKLTIEEKQETVKTPKKYFLYVDLRLSSVDPSDLRGIPRLDTNGYVEWKPPLWVYAVHQKEADGIVFFDEINLAPPSVVASAYNIIHDREIGEYKLADDVLVIAAGNRGAEDRANTFDLPAPLRDRFAEVELNVPDYEQWTQWALSNGVDERIVAFLQFKPSALFRFDSKVKDKASTPRSWQRCSTLIRDLTLKQEQEIALYAASSVGEATAIEFMAFLELQKQIDLNKVLQKPDSVQEIKEISLKWSLLGLLAEHYRKDEKTMPKVADVCNHLEPEFAILLLRFLKNINPAKFGVRIRETSAWVKLANQYAKYLIE